MYILYRYNKYTISQGKPNQPTTLNRPFFCSKTSCCAQFLCQCFAVLLGGLGGSSTKVLGSPVLTPGRSWDAMILRFLREVSILEKKTGGFQKGTIFSWLHPWRLTWNIIMEVWKIMFLSKWVIGRFHVNLPGCISFFRSRFIYKSPTKKDRSNAITQLPKPTRRSIATSFTLLSFIVPRKKHESLPTSPTLRISRDLSRH